MRPEHLDLLHTVGRPCPTPDGARVVVPVRRPDIDSDRYHSTLWVVTTADGDARPLTSGTRDSSPAVSPDGRRVAFLRAGEDAPPQVHVTEIDGGEPICLTDQPLGAGAPSWSPDGRRLAWSARVPEAGRYDTEDADGEKCSAAAEPPRLITTFQYRMDDLGYTNDRRSHVFVGDVPDAPTDPGADLPAVPIEVHQLTDGDHDDSDPTWSPDGRSIAFLSARHEGNDSDLRSAVHVVSATPGDTTAPHAVTAGDLSLHGLAWMPDGRMLALGSDVSPSGRDFVGRPAHLWVTDASVSGEGGPVATRDVTVESDLDLAGGSDAIVVTTGGVLVRSNHRGSTRLLRLDPDAPAGAAPDVVLDGLVVSGHAATSDGSAVFVSAADHERVGDLAEVRDGAANWLTDVSARLRDEAGVIRPIEVDATTTDGHSVHGWVILPDPTTHGSDPHPVLLNIHGGPFTQYPDAFFDEAQVYAGAGYAVVMCNPRGSAGYGEEHGRSIHGAMGTVDADDVLAFLDHVLATGNLPLDADRVGVMGGSYGGYMTALLTTRTDRFAAAIVERGYLDASSFVGSSDIGWFFPHEYHGSPEGAVEQSPMRHVDRVTTPTLVIHSEGDLRTPIEQGQRWFTELKLREVEAELLIFPAESHELSRSGRPKHRHQRFDHILRWWGRHLPVGD